jgi:hypothetical protein
MVTAFVKVVLVIGVDGASAGTGGHYSDTTLGEVRYDPQNKSQTSGRTGMGRAKFKRGRTHMYKDKDRDEVSRMEQHREM